MSRKMIYSDAIEERCEDDGVLVGGVSSIEQEIMQKKREKFQMEIRNSKKKQILNTSRVKMFQKYILEVSSDSSSVKELMPEFVSSDPTVSCLKE